MSSVRQNSLLACLLALSLFGWAIKQAVNIIQVTITTFKLLKELLSAQIFFYNEEIYRYKRASCI